MSTISWIGGVKAVKALLHHNTAKYPMEGRQPASVKARVKLLISLMLIESELEPFGNPQTVVQVEASY